MSCAGSSVQGGPDDQGKTADDGEDQTSHGRHDHEVRRRLNERFREVPVGRRGCDRSRGSLEEQELDDTERRPNDEEDAANWLPGGDKAQARPDDGRGSKNHRERERPNETTPSRSHLVCRVAPEQQQRGDRDHRSNDLRHARGLSQRR